MVKINGTSRTLKLGVDYTRPESVNFDNLVAPDGFVVTGVKFKRVTDSSFNLQLKDVRVQLQIRVTPYDYITGKLINLERTFWISGDSKKLREEMIYNSPDIPSNSPKNFIDSKTNQFIKFVMSDLKKDAGQSTIPFFDAQDVEGEIDFPLGGIGLMHRGHEGYGGFLAFRIYDMNLSKFFQERSNFL
ncbi:uncharacterized protein LOC141523933 [Cotesia typhae]|uniref:uncharacterized protein LOC141523933 n=1 Tax=Cotesia typhae TaxID=2053667 RepID=UPI003D683FE9